MELEVHEEKCHMCAYVIVPGKRDCLCDRVQERGRQRSRGERVLEILSPVLLQEIRKAEGLRDAASGQWEEETPASVALLPQL